MFIVTEYAALKFNRIFCQQTVETLIRCRDTAASDLAMHCLHMSQKHDVRRIWVKYNVLHGMVNKCFQNPNERTFGSKLYMSLVSRRVLTCVQ